MDTVACRRCEETYATDAIRAEARTSQSGKQDTSCPECDAHNSIFLGFYCAPCDRWYGGRNRLKKYDNGSVAKYTCPACDGIIRRGEILDVRQGPHR